MNEKIIAFASDHAGFKLKMNLFNEFRLFGYSAIDLGTHSDNPVDYPDFGYLMAETIMKKKADFGVLICGTGIGMSISANRFPEIRAALTHDPNEAELSRQHNNANILCLGARIVPQKTAKACLNAFIKTKFDGGRHNKRIKKLSNPKNQNKEK